nr:MAG TPA: hypothetical protein [Caudoviricetes sp.]
MCKSNKNKRSLIVSGLLFLFEKKRYKNKRLPSW